MLNIQPVNFFKNNYTAQKKVYAPKLKPLACDTVSFTGARNLNHGLLEAFKNEEICDDISKNAKTVETNLKKSLTRAFADITVSSSNPKGIIEPISVRTKDPRSIREKAASKFEEAIVRHDVNNFINLNLPEDIKSIIQDLVGARIIVNQSDTKRNAAIIDKLISLIEKGEINVTNIEVIAPFEEKDIEPYFDDKDLERLEDAVNKARKRGKKIEIVRTESTSGYSAIHIDLDFSNENLMAKNNGYKGEIQIIGSDVAYFKDLEDYCYKTKQDKDIKSGHPAYDAFVEHLNKYFKYHETGNTDEQDKAVAEAYKRDFNEYTYKAYILQRKKNQHKPGYKKTHLPTLEECGMKGKLPADLDFNYLQQVKKQCDVLYDLSRKKGISPLDIQLLRMYNITLNDQLRLIEPKVAKQIKEYLDQLYQLTTPSDFE